MNYIATTFLILFSINAFSQKNVKNVNPGNQQRNATVLIDSLMAKSYERGLFNGNVFVAKNNKIIYQKSFGFTDERKKTVLNDKSIFNIGSIAKEFNAVAIMMLVERHLVALDDTISKFNLGLPKWAERVTIRHLINYASGIPRIDLLAPKNDAEGWKILRGNDSLLFQPGKNYKYDNSNVFLQRRIIEKVTGKSYEEFVTKNIIKPLKMTNSVFDPRSGFKNRTSCYDMDNVQCPEMQFISGWLWVDINDLYKWIEAMNTNKLISKQSFQTLLENPYAINEGGSLGRYIEKEGLQRHNGVSYKFESIFLNDFKNKAIIILLSNNLNRVWDLGYAVHNLLLGKEYKTPKKSIYQAIRKESISDVNTGIKSYYSLKRSSKEDYMFENPGELNRLGYELLRLGKINESIAVFKLATEEFPENANLFDSLGEAYLTDKQYALALNSYKKAVSLDANSENAKKMVEKIKGLVGN